MSLVAPTLALAISAITPDEPLHAGLLLQPLSAVLSPIEHDALVSRAQHLREDAKRAHLGPRTTSNIALNSDIVRVPSATSSLENNPALLAFEGDPSWAWRGNAGEKSWIWSTSFKRLVHLALIRAEFGDNAIRGVPSRMRWEVKLPVDGSCEESSSWVPLPGGQRDDGDPNEWLLGPREIHARKQSVFADADVCGLRLSITEVDAGGPVLREVAIYEGARSVAAGGDVEVVPVLGSPVLDGSTPENILASQYDHLWAGQIGRDHWSLTITLPESQVVDRLSLMLGEDAVQIPDETATRRKYGVAYMPVHYTVSTAPELESENFEPVPEALPPTSPDDGSILPVRRRLIHLSTPRAVRVVKIDIHDATDRNGVVSPVMGAPVIREVALFAANDPRPVIRPPLFLSVNANPSPLLESTRELERGPDAHARMAYHRLRRIIGGFDADSRWHPDPSRRRDRGAGRFLEAIDGDDTTLATPWIQALSPPPVVMLSGSLSWEFGDETKPFKDRSGKPTWTWDPTALPTDADRGMGHLRGAVRHRVAPFIGFCGGAQILALLEAGATDGNAPVDPRESKPVDVEDVLQRIDNRPIHGALTEGVPIERSWWFDAPAADSYRPTIKLDATSPLFDFSRVAPPRRESRELPISHVDMLRPSAFDGPLGTLEIVAESEVCGPWVDSDGGEPTTASETVPGSSCVRVPQAFLSRDEHAYPLVGFQFHPEQRDFKRLGPNSPPEARGDALNVMANTVDLVLDAYLRLYWPFS
ncbi:MAG: hypothetical protein U0165_12985 [Polyangiaceae bacterium]